MVSVIVAMDEKGGIGRDNSIPWHISEDFKHFKKITMGHPIVMGRKTFESIGQVLPGRANIVVTRNLENKTEVPNVLWADSLESALNIAKDKTGGEEIFIIGGGQIFKEAIEKSLVDKLYLTIVEGNFDADTFFPAYSEFKTVKEEDREEGDYKFKFQELRKN